MITFSSIIDSITQILCQIIGVLFILATVVFLWGVVQYVIASGSEDKMKEGRQYIIYGLFGLFIMVAMWGIVNAAVLTFFGSGGGGFNQCQFFGVGGGGGGFGNDDGDPFASDGACQCRDSGGNYFGNLYPAINNSCNDFASGGTVCGNACPGRCTY